jgi:hypothetical protein
MFPTMIRYASASAYVLVVKLEGNMSYTMNSLKGFARVVTWLCDCVNR